MLCRRTAVGALASAALLFAGACTDVPPTDPLDSAPDASALFGSAPDPAAFDGGLDAYFERMAERIPGFGGMYRDEDGTLVARMVRERQTMTAREVSLALREWAPVLGVDDVGAVEIRDGRFDFRELRAMRSRADAAVWQLRGVVFTDADEAGNQVHIGVESAAARAAVEHAVAMLGLPEGAVRISITEPEYPMQTLRDRVRPVAGGLQINFPGFLCTLGFNVRPAHPAGQHIHGFVTNSHCTSVRGTVTNTPYWQPSSSIADSFIGNEEWDIPFFTNADNPVCPVGNLCRWSDAAGARYAPGVENNFGQIYRPVAIGSLTIDPVTPRFNITAERPRTLVGDIVNKVGRTTGWSSGAVFASCVNVGVAGTNPLQVMLCQDRANQTPAVMGGDSGSPYFEIIGPNEVRLVGILWGSTTFSPMQNIRFENQGPQPWITFPGQTPPPPGGPPSPP